jgi:thioredoxin-like negative regulator of GroEL
MHFAHALADSGHLKEALPFANRAADLAPWNPAVLATLARVAVELGKCNEGLVLQARATDLSDAKDNRTDFQKKLRDYEARCANATPPAR